ncbi:tRNA (N(6)-L-threonylcarbamoyladenosine(37)-C(2))-methylthiotransferase MtaB [Mageeibacillus indolicus]|uniref:tRNA (N(6)-L-threonylcarbamoyladenosine(37)-C(2))-methylthiotransferase MtaB n=1 Tax=Mageeibacillus indolicus TaxID=884684 RepID=A0A2J8B0Z3_9FIRM|nr:tRNA (N(6)-L-threonylcarbamoyladenosine(37)-C(2))-methylthiotransferase MtaB [Mageeibacillus indolicus]PNH18426.1 tRNA (N(6)-L-threonylcarbamoyladenosine(37)-C(2))-methylthiotransferase MtaB [Mageeibacillus indolicus]
MSKGQENILGNMVQGEKRPTVALFNLGCKVNRYETDAVAQQFATAGYEVVDFDSVADIYVLNTCAVTGEAGRKSGQMLRRARKKNPAAVVAVMGCHVQLGGECSAADIVVGTQGKKRVFAAVEHFRAEWAEHDFAADARPARLDMIQTLALADAPDFEDFGAVDQQSETRAYIKIQDGCNNFCSYCAIPFARGRVRSRSEESILREGRGIAAAGFKEVVITGIHVCSYGRDRGESSTALTSLCAKLAELPGLDRIRLGSLEPLSVSAAFIEAASANPKLCPHFHLSLQSGSDTVLRRMRRRYTTENYRQVVNGLRAAYGERLGLTTDIIVGFPGETEAEFAETVAFCREMSFTRMHIFRYSERAGTAATQFEGKVEASVAAYRAEELAKVAAELQAAHQARRQGKNDLVLLEQRDKEGYFEGYAPNYDPIVLGFDTSELKSGLIIPVRLIGIRNGRFIGRPLS